MTRTHIRRSPLAILAAFLLAAVFATSASAAAPYVWTEPATEVTATEATLNVKVQVKVAPTETLAGFQYGLTTEYGQATESHIYKNGGYVFTLQQRVTGLTPGTTYHFQAAAWDYKYGGGALGEDRTFTTSGGLYLTHEAGGEENAVIFPTSPKWLLTATEPSDRITLNFGEVETKCKVESLGPYKTGPFTQFNAAQEGLFECSNGATVKMNGCYFTYGLNKAGPPYNGSMSLTCNTKSMEVVFSGICTATIGAQSASGTPASYETVDRGKDSAISVSTNATGLTYSKGGGSFCFLLNGKTASITGKMVLSGL